MTPAFEQEQGNRRRRAKEAVLAWFAARGWTPFAFQQEAWEAYLAGESGLIHAPTGIGKTYAAGFGPLMAWMAESASRPDQSTTDGRRGRPEAPPLNTIWITPLRALAGDVHAALAAAAAGLALPWTVQVRTGDTAATVKRRQKQRLPTALVTTPESLHLLLSYPGARERFAGLQALVVDEWHELMGSKRGVLVELARARLCSWQPGLKTWGLSATLGNTAAAMSALLGADADRGRLVTDRRPKPLIVESLIPDPVDRFPWAGHLGTAMLPQVLDRIEAAKSVLIFTNTRSQAEIWYQAITGARPDWKNAFALHHSAIARSAREAAEQGLAGGRLKGVVCTSSLDLGVDFSPVDLVVQIGSPKGIGRLMQRAGRSGHGPGKTSRVVCVPTHALELVEAAAARSAIEAGRIEPRRPVTLALDVLSQFLVTAALGDGFSPDAMYRQLRKTHAFGALSRADYSWVLDFTANGGASLAAYPAYRKLVQTAGRYRPASKEIAARHRMGIGTITSDAAIQVKYLNGRRLGAVEERFVSRLKKGDHFTFAGRRLEFVRIREMTLWVRRSRSRAGPVPQWMGGRMPLSTELAAGVRAELHRAAGGARRSAEMAAVGPILELQARWSAVPKADELLVETWTSREGRHLVLFPFEGHLVNEGLGALLAYRLSQATPLTVTIAVNDYGIELLSDRRIPTEAFESRRIFQTDRLLEDIIESVNAAEMGRRRFREIARVAGLVFQGYPGRQKSGGQIQASSSLLYNVFRRYEPENLLLAQATREVLSRQLEFQRLFDALNRMAAATLRLIETDQVTPLAFPIMVNRLRTRVSSETLADRVRRMQRTLEKQANQ